jgi:hypothetical protein
MSDRNSAHASTIIVSIAAILAFFLTATLPLIAQSTGACDLNAGTREVIREAAKRERANEEKVKNYTWIERVEKRNLNSDGSIKSTEIRTHEFMVIYGELVRRLVSVNDKPISEKEKAKQDEKIEKLIRERENETSEQKQKRIARYDKEQADAREFVEEVTDAYNLTVLPSEQIAGHNAYVLDAVPKPGYQPRHKQAKILPKFRFRVWLNSEDCSWIKLDAEATDTITYGGILARIGKGTRLLIEQTEVNDEIWLPRHVAVKVGARLMLLKKLNLDLDITYSDYRKFRAESRVVPGSEVEQH